MVCKLLAAIVAEVVVLPAVPSASELVELLIDLVQHLYDHSDNVWDIGARCTFCICVECWLLPNVSGCSWLLLAACAWG